MLAYHNDPKIKAAALARMAKHRAADQLVKGIYWENGKGCAIGCLYHSRNHRDAERVHGIPLPLAGLFDAIFEGLPNGEAQAWPERFLEAVQPGADLSGVWPVWAEWMLREVALPAAGDDAMVKATILTVAYLYRDRVASSDPRWTMAAAGAAWAAWAVRAEAEAGAADAGRAVWGRMADKLFELLETA